MASTSIKVFSINGTFLGHERASTCSCPLEMLFVIVVVVGTFHDFWPRELYLGHNSFRAFWGALGEPFGGALWGSLSGEPSRGAFREGHFG